MASGVRLGRDVAKGDCLFAARDFLAGEHLVEDPTAHLCTLNRFSVTASTTRRCGRCLRPLGPLSVHARDIPEATLKALEPFAADVLYDRHQCRQKGCRQGFCSPECEIAAWDAGHSLLCHTEDDRESPLARLYATQTWRRSATFRLAVAALAEAVHTHRVQIGDHHQHELAHCRLLDQYCYAGQSHKEAKAALRGMNSGLTLVTEAWNLSPEEAGFVDEIFPAIVSAVVLNAQEVKLDAVLPKVVANAAEKAGAVTVVAEAVRDILQSGALEEAPESSVGLFPTHCKANHACEGGPDANSRVQAIGDGIGVALVATRDIADGEEIAFDYLAGDAGDAMTRRQTLQHKYGFECGCTQCRCSKAIL